MQKVSGRNPQDQNLIIIILPTISSCWQAEKVATKAICKPDLLKTFMDLDKGLEMIKKSLDNYLENKRQQFPRFYFLSNENLLDILGQAKDPRNVQVTLRCMNVFRSQGFWQDRSTQDIDFLDPVSKTHSHEKMILSTLFLLRMDSNDSTQYARVISGRRGKL